MSSKKAAPAKQKTPFKEGWRAETESDIREHVRHIFRGYKPGENPQERIILNNAIALLRKMETVEAYSVVDEATREKNRKGCPCQRACPRRKKVREGCLYLPEEGIFHIAIVYCATAAIGTPHRRIHDAPRGEIEKHIKTIEFLCDGIRDLTVPDSEAYWEKLPGESDDICRMAYRYRSYPYLMVPTGERVSDETLLRHLEIIRDALAYRAALRPKRGAPAERARNHLIYLLTTQFALSLGDPLYKAVAHLLKATFGETWKPASLRTFVSALKKKMTAPVG